MFHNSRNIYSTISTGRRLMSFSQRAKGWKDRFAESRFMEYWKNLMADYKTALLDIKQEYKDKPVKTGIYTALVGFSCYCYKHNPTAQDFREDLVKSALNLTLVNEAYCNPGSLERVKQIEQLYNEGVVRYLSLGIGSVMWVDNYHSDTKLYKATCEHLTWEFKTFFDRIIDWGFLGRWWVLHEKMTDYDVADPEV